MNKSMFGWSYPPGAANDPDAPYNREEEPIDLRNGRTLKGYGRQDGLNGKDADLCDGGQNVVTEAYWFSDGTIRISGRRYASIVPNSEATDEQMDLAQECVMGCGYGGEWDGDYWVLGEDYSLSASHDWDYDLDDESNIKAATAAAYAAINKDSEPFEQAMAALNADILAIE